MIIAIDGPAGSGKSSIAKLLAEELKFKYLDSGALYRTITLWILTNLLKAKKLDVPYLWNQTIRKYASYITIEETQNFLSRDNFLALLKLLSLKIEFIDGIQNMFLDKENVSQIIRFPEVTANVPYVADFAPCRNKVNNVLRRFCQKNDTIIDGRDIGTVVFPDADMKFYLDASADVRAERRYKELQASLGRVDKSDTLDLRKIKAEIIARDKVDKEREIAPLRKADDADYIDTSSLSKNDVFTLLLEKINKARTC
jgi:cytidylate kinase